MSEGEGAPAAPRTELNVVFVDQSKDAKDAARLAAEKRLADEVNSGGRFARAFKRFWKENTWKEYYIQKYERQALGQIEQTGSTLAFDTTEADRARATQVTIDRFQAEDDAVIHDEAGEKRDIVGPQSEFATAIKDLIAQNVRGEISDAAMEEEKNRILAAFAEHSDEYRGLFKEGRLKADNMIQIANAVKAAVEHGESLEDVMSGMKIITGEARNSARTEVNYNVVDKLMEKVQSSRIGSLVQPEVLGTAAAIAQGLLRFGGKRLTSTLLAFAPALGAGIHTALRENKRVKDERRMHGRQMAMGGEIEDGSKRREEMEGARYETVTAQSLIDQLKASFEGEGALGSEAAVAAAIAALGEAAARNTASDSKGADFISYSSEAKVGEERWALDVAIAQAKVAARQGMNDQMRQYMANLMGLGPDASVDAIISASMANFTQSTIETDMSAKDAAFQKLKTRRVLLAGATGMVGSFVGGMAAQEIRGFFDPSTVGLADGLTGQQANLIGGQQHNTLMQSWFHGETTTHFVAPSSVYDTYSGGHIQLSNDQIAQFSNGEMQILDKSGNVIVDHLAVNHDGTLPSASSSILQQHGYNVAHTTVQGPDVVTQHTGSPKGFLTAHGAVNVKRDFPYDNNTPAPEFDQNELGLWEAGHKGIGVNGHYAYSVSHMTKGGSYHGANSANWSALAHDGKLKVALSATRGTQGSVLMVDIKPDGSIDIDPNSAAGQLFENRGGEAVFKGAYMEVVEERGVQGGLDHIRPLATIVGENNPGNLSWTEKTPTFTDIAKITPSPREVLGDVTEIPVGPPLGMRRPLERLAARRRDGEDGGGYYYDSEASPEEADRIKRELSPRLQGDPDARLSLNQETAWYRNELARRRGQEGVAHLEAQIDSSPELSDMDGALETIVTIPVGAAFESENIFKTLSLYGQQDQDALKKSLVVLNVNWFDTAKNNPEQWEKVQKTISEIERARSQFPDLKIAVVTNEYEEAKVRASGGPHGYLARDLVDATLLAIRKNVDEGHLRPDQDITIIRHDADMEGLSRHHLKKFQETAKSSPEADFFKGVTRFGVESSKKYPGYGIVKSVTAALSLESTHRGHVQSGGANFGIRAATLAAMGGLGALPEKTGAGSDDTVVAKRLKVARALGAGSHTAYGPTDRGIYTSEAAKAARGKRYAKPVIGATVDTNADRFIAMYLTGRHYQEVWSEGEYSDGEGSYKRRDADAGIMDRITRETTEQGARIYSLIEDQISAELRHADESVGNRVITMYFGAEPGLYTLTRTPGKAPVFKLTTAGRAWLQKRLERETNGRYGSYGTRKMRQLYGDRSHKRQPVPRESPLVAPLQ